MEDRIDPQQNIALPEPKKKWVILTVVLALIIIGLIGWAKWKTTTPKVETNETLEGVDANNDGVRDDVEQYIIAKYSDPMTQKALMQYAHSLQDSLLNSVDNHSARVLTEKNFRSIDCLDYIIRDNNENNLVKMTNDIEARVFNTEQRKLKRKEITNLVFGVFSSPPMNLRKAQCNFDTETGNPIEWKTYEDKKFGFEIQLPKDWQINKNAHLSIEGETYFASPETSKIYEEYLKNCGGKCEGDGGPEDYDIYFYPREMEKHKNLGTISLDNNMWYVYESGGLYGTINYELIKNGKVYTFGLVSGDEETNELLQAILFTFKFIESSSSKMNADLLPLYGNCEWSNPTAATRDYQQQNGDDYTLVKLSGYETNCATGVNLRDFYDQKLKNLGWQDDVGTWADGPGESWWGYIKNGKHIIIFSAHASTGTTIFSD